MATKKVPKDTEKAKLYDELSKSGKIPGLATIDDYTVEGLRTVKSLSDFIDEIQKEKATLEKNAADSIKAQKEIKKKESAKEESLFETIVSNHTEEISVYGLGRNNGSIFKMRENKDIKYVFVPTVGRVVHSMSGKNVPVE